MDNELLDRLDTIINDLNDCIESKEIISLKERLLNRDDIKEKLEILKKEDKNSELYKKTKKELFEDKDYSNFKHLENDFHYLSMEITKMLKELK